MKKKIRDLSLNGIEYCWMVQEDIWPNHTVKIWLKDRGKIPWCEATTKEFRTITPKHIENIVENIFKLEEIKDKLLLKNYTHKCKLENICTNLEPNT